MAGEEEYDFGAVFQAIFIPKQRPPPDPLPQDVAVSVSTYPPLGQVTQLKSQDVSFVAVLEAPVGRGDEPWEVALVHAASSDKDQEWTEQVLTRTPSGNDGQVPSTLQPVGDTPRLYFAGRLSVQSSLAFTVKFRHGPDQPWRWTRDEQGMGDGVVVINDDLDQKDTKSNLPDLIHDLNPNLKWKPLMSQCPGTRLWSMEAAVDASRDDQSAVVDIPIGTPWGGFLRWFALVRIWSPWLAPRHGKSKFDVDKDSVVVSFLSPQGRHMVFLAISGLSDVMSVFRSSESGSFLLNVRSDEETPSTATVLVATGDNFESAMATVMYQARSLTVSSTKWTGEHTKEMAALNDSVRRQSHEGWQDGLGFCTWNALGQRLTEEKVLEAVDTLAENKINVTSLIIDDNWQNIDYRGHGQFQHGWNDFEAEPKAFPRGLKATISDIRSKHPNIKHIAVWHALLGYWAGIAPEGNLAKIYKTEEVIREDSLRRNLPMGGKMTVIAKEDVNKFYDDFYRFLVSCGIDSVKTDAQFMMDTWVSAKARRELMHTYLDAWTISTLRHFSSRAISCMSQTPQILFYSQIPQNRPAVLCRNSDDFFPTIPASHPWHVWTNAHNSLLTQHLNVLPDWDMFQTVHDYSSFHAAARCISGGPIYFTDVPGQHNMDLLNQMTGPTPHGNTVIFRPSVVARSIDHYVGYDDYSLLKVGAYHGAAATGASIMGVFNVSTRPVTDIIPLSRFPGVIPSNTYVIRCHATGSVTPPVQISSPASFLTVSLGVRGHEIFCAYPLSVFQREAKGPVHVANLGLTKKMSGCAAVLSNSFKLLDNGRLFLETKVKALGVLGVYISNLPELSIEDHFMVTILGQPIPPRTVRKANENVVEIDIEAAWNEIGRPTGFSDDLDLKVYFSLEP